MRKKLLRSRSGFEKPESREEAIMQNILGASNVLEPAESNIEEILQAILYNTPYTKKAESEIEKILLAIKNNGTYDGEGESRDMKILIAILNNLDYTEEAESRIEELFIEWLHQRSSIKVLEGIPPLSFTSKGKPLTAWSITGNTVQNGTPTPENPVEVFGCGDYDSETGLYKIPVVTRGKNLFDKTTARYEVAINGANMFENYPGSASFVIPVIKGIKNYTLKVKSDVNITVIRIGFCDKPIPVPGETVNNMKQIANSKNPIVTSSNENNLPYIVVQIGGAFVDSYGLDTVQLEIGNTATPYEPYHEPITTPIYLPTPLYSGEVMRSNGTIIRSDGTTETFTAPQIPTLNGTTVIDVDTAVKPSSIYIEYK